jgi:hypothetical protein
MNLHHAVSMVGLGKSDENCVRGLDETERVCCMCVWADVEG